MKARLIVLFLLTVFLIGACSACSKAPAESDPSSQPAAESSAASLAETSFSAPTAPPAPSETAAPLEAPATEAAEKPRLAEFSDAELLSILLENGLCFTWITDAAGHPITDPAGYAMNDIRRDIADIEADPYGFMGHLNASQYNLGVETERRAVCRYYEWPLIQLVLEDMTGTGTGVSVFQLWSLPDAFFGRRTKATETGAEMTFISPSAFAPDFRRKMTIYLEPAEVILQMEQEEDPATNLKTDPGGTGFPDGSAIIYDHGNNAYTVYLRPEDGPAAVKIEASLTLEELADLISGSRLFEGE